MKKIVFFGLLFSFFAPFSHGDISADYYRYFKLVIENKAGLPQLIEQCETMLRTENLPPWMYLGLHSDLSSWHARSKQYEKAISYFEKAVEFGYCDFIALHHTPAYRPLFKNEKFQAIYRKMRISPADMRELYWIYSELQFIFHDTSMIITENMNRPDSDYTQVPQAAISTRVPQSPTILSGRQVVWMAQRYQREMVMASDISRINHNMNRNIIDNMNSGSSNHQSNKMYQIQQSIRMARERAIRRQNAALSRRFLLPEGISFQPEPCPPLGSIPLPNQGGQQTENPENVEPGDPGEHDGQEESVEEETSENRGEEDPEE